MDHSFIEETNQIDRYVRGTMPAAERTAFEEHFLDCPECLEQLEIASRLRESVRIAGADLAATSERSVPAARPRAFPGWRWLVAAAAACAAVAVFSLVSLVRTRGDLERIQLAYTSDQARSRAILEDAGQNAPMLYMLNQTRGPQGEAQTVELPRSPRWLVFSVPTDTSQFQAFRAVLRTQDGRVVWQKDDIQPSSPDTVAVSVLSTALAPGSYVMCVEGRNAAKRYVGVSTASLIFRSGAEQRQ